MTLIFLVESGGMLMVGIILNKVVSCFRKKRRVLRVFKPEHMATLLKKGGVLAMPLHLRERIGRNATIMKMSCIQVHVTLCATDVDCDMSFG